MKRILSLLLITTFLFCSLPFNVLAETEGKNYIYTEEFCNSVNDYIISLGLGELYFDVDTTADDYVEGNPSTYTYLNLFTPKNIATSDKIVVFETNETLANFQIVGHNNTPTSEKIRDYTFTSDTFFHQNNPCGYCQVAKYDKVYGIAEIKSNITLAKLADLFPSINNKSQNIQKAEELLKTRYDIYSHLMELKEFGDYRLYYNDTSYLQFLTRKVVIGEYEFEIFANQTPYDMGLYVISNEEVYTLEEAWETGIVTDLDTVYTAIKEHNDIQYNFTVEKTAVATAQDIIEKRYEGYQFNIISLGIIEDCMLCYNDIEKTLFTTREFVIEDYEFNLFAMQSFSEESDPTQIYDMGLYVISDDTAYTFEEAYEAGIVTDLDAVYEMITARDDINYNFTMEKIVENPPVDEPETSVTTEIGKIKAGEKVKPFNIVNPDNGAVTFKAENSKIATVNAKGVVSALQKGKAKFVVTVGEEQFNCKVKVTSNPKLMKNNKKIKAIKLSRKKTVKLQLLGKVKNIKNVYTNTKKAKITSGKNATTIKVKGLKKGTTTLKIKVNGVKTLKLKVTVK